MSSRKRPLAELSQPYSTPARYTPSTPHALRALQQRSSFKQRSTRSVRHHNNGITDTVRPDGSARNILRQFAKITAPLTKKRISTPIHHDSNNSVNDKENQNPDENEDDSILLKKPAFTIEESVEEDDSELPVPPTPSILPEDDDDDEEDPTITFPDLTRLQRARPASEAGSRRKSRTSLPDRDGESARDEQEDDFEGDATMMTERGRRAFSEEVTGRLSRYSFGSIRMSDFGPELEIKRDSGRQKRLVESNFDDSLANEYDNPVDLGGETENLRGLQHSPTGVFDVDDSIQLPGLGDETFNLQVPDDNDDTQELGSEFLTHANAQSNANTHPDPAGDQQPLQRLDNDNTRPTNHSPVLSRQQTLLENATTQVQTTRRKRVKLTRHGIAVPSLPTSLVKRIAIETQTKLGRRKPTLGRDHIRALEQATEWYFEQVGEDLAAYSSHGRRRKRVDTEDVLLLMRRQKVLLEDGELRSLAAEWLPRETLEELDLPEQP